MAFTTCLDAERISATRFPLSARHQLAEHLVLMRASALFSGLSQPECSEIFSFARARSFARDEILFSQGQPVRNLIFLQSGSVKHTQVSENGSEVLLSDESFVKHSLVAVWVEKRVMEKMENGKTVSHLSHHPGYGDGWSDYFVCKSKTERRGMESRDALAHLSRLGVESNEQFVGQGYANDFGWLAGCPQTLLEGDEVRLVTGNHAGHEEQDVAYRRAATPHSRACPGACPSHVPAAPLRQAWRLSCWTACRSPASLP